MARSARTEPDTGRSRKGKLWVVGTPLGNLGDLSPRAREVLATADAILCEDTRVTAKLFGPNDEHGPLERADAHVLSMAIPALIARLERGAWLALVSDAGMPVISDPGVGLIDAALASGIAVEVVPGPSAVSCALAASGLSCGRYFFQGFLARKGRARSQQLHGLAELSAAVVIYESPHRVQRTLADLAELVGDRRVALCRELTKLHEEVLRGSCGELLEELARREAQGSKLKGECVIVVEAPSQRPHNQKTPGKAQRYGGIDGDPSGDPCSFSADVEERRVARGPAAAPIQDLSTLAREYLAEGLTPAKAAKALALRLGISRNQAYTAVLSAKNAQDESYRAKQ